MTPVDKLITITSLSISHPYSFKETSCSDEPLISISSIMKIKDVWNSFISVIQNFCRRLFGKDSLSKFTDDSPTPLPSEIDSTDGSVTPVSPNLSRPTTPEQLPTPPNPANKPRTRQKTITSLAIGSPYAVQDLPKTEEAEFIDFLNENFTKYLPLVYESLQDKIKEAHPDLSTSGTFGKSESQRGDVQITFTYNKVTRHGSSYLKFFKDPQLSDELKKLQFLVDISVSQTLPNALDCLQKKGYFDFTDFQKIPTFNRQKIQMVLMPDKKTIQISMLFQLKISLFVEEKTGQVPDIQTAVENKFYILNFNLCLNPEYNPNSTNPVAYTQVLIDDFNATLLTDGEARQLLSQAVPAEA